MIVHSPTKTYSDPVMEFVTVQAIRMRYTALRLRRLSRVMIQKTKSITLNRAIDNTSLPGIPELYTVLAETCVEWGDVREYITPEWEPSGHTEKDKPCPDALPKQDDDSCEVSLPAPPRPPRACTFGLQCYKVGCRFSHPSGSVSYTHLTLPTICSV